MSLRLRMCFSIAPLSNLLWIMLSWDANEAASLGMRSDPQLSAWNFYIGPVVVRDVNEV